MQPNSRSYLFVPANRPERYAKALASGSDSIIIDLEDAVPPADKDGARTALAAWLSPEQPVLVRINAADTPWFAADCALAARPGVAGIVLPKSEHPQVIGRLAHTGKPVMPLIESAAGFARLDALAHAEGVDRLIFGSIDFQADLGLRAEEDELLPFRLQLVLASRLAGIAPPVDGVSTAFDDAERLDVDTRRAVRLGFSGKLCIHPRQVEAINRGFTPSSEEIDWAQRVIDADRRSGGAAVSVDGRMVDRPVVLRAQALLRDAER